MKKVFARLGVRTSPKNLPLRRGGAYFIFGKRNANLSCSADEHLSEVDDRAHKYHERNINFDSERQKLRVRAFDADSRRTDCYRQRRNHLARASSRRVRRRNPRLNGFVRANRLTCYDLQLAEQNATGRRRAGYVSADRAEKRRNQRVSRARRRDRRIRDLSRHAAVAHNFCRRDNRDNRNHREFQAVDCLFEHAQHLAETRALLGTRDKSRQQNQDARRINPDECVRRTALAVVNRNRRFELH